MWVKMICAVLDAAHKQQIEETIDVVKEGSRGDRSVHVGRALRAGRRPAVSFAWSDTRARLRVS